MDWLMLAEWCARAILVLLFGLSIWSIKIMIDRKRFFASLSKSPSWEEAKTGQTENGFYHDCANSLSSQSSTGAVEREFENFLSSERPRLEKGLSVLGTLGATAPFIGLLGTVLGIIKAFGDLSINSQNTNAVMFALAEALVLTAVGLAVALPAVVAFNYFNRKVRSTIAHCAVLKNLRLNQLEASA